MFSRGIIATVLLEVTIFGGAFRHNSKNANEKQGINRDMYSDKAKMCEKRGTVRDRLFKRQHTYESV